MLRYAITWAGYMTEHEGGSYVRYEDAAAELAERDRRIAEMDRVALEYFGVTISSLMEDDE